MDIEIFEKAKEMSRRIDNLQAKVDSYDSFCEIYGQYRKHSRLALLTTKENPDVILCDDYDSVKEFIDFIHKTNVEKLHVLKKEFNNL